ncbi:EAL domain-containing protein [Anoxybacterium hadale]|uniref:EAL domain-containing protein n=1 Tax=Anoxybacterium hadale TaxID=3408580 RepID=A0ACD1AAL1_9FIRM|nr:EAL domain-containing protein [Clostridiales bacterium]
MNSAKCRKRLETLVKDNLIVIMPILLIGLLFITWLYYDSISNEIDKEQEKTRIMAHGVDVQLNSSIQALKQIGILLSYHQADENSKNTELLLRQFEENQTVFQSIQLVDKRDDSQSPASITLSSEKAAITISMPSGEMELIGIIDFPTICSEMLTSQGIGDDTLSIALIQGKNSPVMLKDFSNRTKKQNRYYEELISRAAKTKASDAYLRFPGNGGIVTTAELKSVPWTLICVRDPARIHYVVIPLIVFLLANLVMIILYLSMSMRRFRKIRRTIELKDVKLEFLEYHDRLTGVENRAYLYQKLDLKSYLGSAKNMALIYINVDSFKNVNDTFGHSFGDELLINVSGVLKNCMADPCKLIHLGGDEFACLIPDRDYSEVFDMIQNIRNQFMDSIICCDRSIYISISIGVSMYPDHGKDFDTLLRYADIALHSAKAQGKSAFAFYEPSMNLAIEKRLKIEQHLRSTPELDEFYIVFQPQVSTKSGTIRGFEALLRWNSDTLGNVDTGEFISVAEDTGIIVPIGEWVIREACSQIGSLNSARNTSYTLAVNVSPIQLKSPGYSSNLKKILEETSFDPKLLEIEITENVFIHHKDGMITETLEELLRIGVRVALDDFGTGYSSLSYLNKLPIQTLKVDKNFISNQRDPRTRSMLESIIIMAHKLQLSVIAEGVEKKEELALLKRLDCDFIQGYYFSKPVLFEEIFSLDIL